MIQETPVLPFPVPQATFWYNLASDSITYWLQENTDYPQESVLLWKYIYLCKLITQQSSSI